MNIYYCNCLYTQSRSTLLNRVNCGIVPGTHPSGPALVTVPSPSPITGWPRDEPTGRHPHTVSNCVCVCVCKLVCVIVCSSIIFVPSTLPNQRTTPLRTLEKKKKSIGRARVPRPDTTRAFVVYIVPGIVIALLRRAWTRLQQFMTMAKKKKTHEDTLGSR